MFIPRSFRPLTTAVAVAVTVSLAGCQNDDVSPTPFAFTAVTNAPLASTQTSNAITVGDINKTAPVSITGGSYSVNGGAYTTTAGNVKAGDQITVQLVAAAAPATAKSVQLTVGDTTEPYSVTTVDANTATTQGLATKVSNIVVIYAENRSFDNMFGHFPNANGIPASAIPPQLDRDGTVLPKLPVTWGGVTVAGSSAVITQAQSDGLANAPFHIETAFQANGGGTPSLNTITRDLYHRFFENQMQINGGTNDKFAAYGDSGGLLMGYWDASSTSLYGLASQYVLADNFFQAAFGGSFLNHQYLVCACAPTYPSADTAAAHPTISVVDMNGAAYTHNLTLNTASASYKASALDGIPVFTLSGNIAPLDYFGTGDGYRAVNTMQPPYQPSGNAPAGTDSTHLYASTAAATTLPPQTQTTIGDQLSAKNISWAWYGGAWNQATASTTAATYAQPLANPDPVTGLARAPTFQFHHQPFNYYANFDPVTHAVERAAHLKDYDDLVAAASSGTLPAVAFYKPQGNLNQHPGYANVADADAHIAQLVNRLMTGPQADHLVIVITYDEFGGQWDHVAPPKGDLLGPGTRIPAIIVSKFAKKGTVDHTQYDTASILRLIDRRFGIAPLPGVTARDTALQANGKPAMGDLTNALQLY
ncbi:MAG: acid phosphatase [Pseudomonadota bacterium]